MRSFFTIATLLFCISLCFSQSTEQRYKQQQEELRKKTTTQREVLSKKITEQRDTYKEKMEKQRIAYKNYLKSNWSSFRKVSGVSLPTSPDSLDIKTVEIPKIKEDENPNIEIIDALLKAGVNETQAVNITLEIIDSLGIDAIKEGQSIGIATEKNNETVPVAVSYQIDSQETSNLLQGETDYKYVESNGKTRKSGCIISKTKYIFPLSGTCRKTSAFGMREHPILKKPKIHNGVDYGAPRGSNVYAIASGIVEISGFDNVSGYYVAIKHADGMLSYYLHLNEKGIAKGSNVEAGQVIGKVGSTGRSTGPHLHLGIKKNGAWQNSELLFYS
jgi:murein DD-endopeptidase MepM/ murein hydrolase activator NlpD